ncbi:uncharacterized protein Dwil_GK27267 [Drosophila willistoni]|uniref:LRRCT domain-containing protein n=1 Tax=Drosophila willistoni TaxID=7260 RepID=A0A0Q9WRJ1_DROWI|nr:phospholipase A2 inhibitor beta [Drosophila willistoni]KRF98753.1 uncharacterized protein Dwil_GK27267 [Drosophila willistoni]
MPIPIVGSSVYHFENNSLTQLPNFSSEGLDNVLQLHLANNKLTSLSVEQLPQNLTWLDIRNNSLNSIDSKVVEFLKNREINILQTGIKWRPSCENKDLISYLSNLKKYVKIEFWHDSIDNPVFYERLNGPCPTDCTCCFEDNQLLVNCTGTGYYTVPKLSNLIIGDSSLLLEDNRILSLSTTGFLRNSTIKELNVKNNYINEIHLDELPVNLTLLDIRENHLKALDDDVTDFIAHLPQIRLSDNPWQCNCKYLKFLNYLRKTNPIEYKAALKNCNVQEDCPDHCTCCKNDSDRKTSIKCN